MAGRETPDRGRCPEQHLLDRGCDAVGIDRLPDTGLAMASTDCHPAVCSRHPYPLVRLVGSWGVGDTEARDKMNHFPGVSEVKNPPANAGDVGLIPGLEGSPGGGLGKPVQYSCLEIPSTEEPGSLAHGVANNNPFNNYNNFNKDSCLYSHFTDKKNETRGRKDSDMT